MNSVLVKKMRLHSVDFRFYNVFGREIRRKSALRSDILIVSTEVMHRPRSDSPIHFEIQNIWQWNVGWAGSTKIWKKNQSGDFGAILGRLKTLSWAGSTQKFQNKIGLSWLNSNFPTNFGLCRPNPNVLERIWYMFWISKCRGESDLGLCMTSVLAMRMMLHSADFRRILQPNTF